MSNAGRFKHLARAVGLFALVLGQSAWAGNVQFASDRPAINYSNAPRANAHMHGAMVGAAGKSTWAPAPNVFRAILPPVTIDQSRQAVERNGQALPANLNEGVVLSTGRSMMGIARVGGDANPLGPASITELARALRNHPDLIYQYVRNNIEFYPVWGIQKGALGTVLDNQGTGMDQAALMVELLRASGYTANYVRGVVKLPAQQFKEWYGFDTTSVCGVLNQLGQGQIPIYSINATSSGSCPTLQAPMTDVSVEHVWVKVNIGGTNYVFDPSYKPHAFTTGINLASAAGYSASTYLTSARTGASIATDTVQNLNRTNIRANLTNHASTLAQWLRTNKPTATLDDVIGGQTIVPYLGGSLRQTALPYQDAGYSTIESSELPNGYRPTLRIRYQGIDQTFTSDAIYGKRLTLTFNGTQPVLKLNGVQVGVTGTAVAAGATSTVTFTVTHNAYASTFKKAALAGHPKAQYRIGLAYYKAFGVDLDKWAAAEWFGRSAAQGMPGAQYMLAEMLLSGDGVKQDPASAARLYAQAADGGNLWARKKLGDLYALGESVPQDSKRAIREYETAADAGLVEATHAIGVVYEFGLPQVEKDARRAQAWHVRAAQEGSARSQYRLGLMYQFPSKGLVSVPDFAKAAYWYRKAAEQGVTRAQVNLASILLAGVGVPQDAEQAFMWTKRAAEQGEGRAQTNLGLNYLQGAGTAQDLVQARLWLEKAAQQGETGAQQLLGMPYLHGTGVPEDEARGKLWLQRAELNGL